MEIIQLILGYVKNLQTTYGKYLPLINTLKGIIEGKFKVVGCDVFYPSEEEVLAELSKKDKKMYEEFKKIVANNTITPPNFDSSNPVSSQKLDLDKPITPQEIRDVLEEEDCIPEDGSASDSNKTDEEEQTEQEPPFSEEELKNLLEELAAQCDLSNINFDSINKELEPPFSEEEVKEAMEECPPEIKDGPDIGSPFNDNVKPSPIVPPTDEPEPINSSDIQAVLDLLSPDQAKCTQKLLDSSKELTDKIKKYNEITNYEQQYKKNRDFYFPIWKMYEKYDKALKSIFSINPLLKTRDLIKPLEAYSSEIKIIDYVDKGLQIFDIEIKSDGEIKGSYYDAEKKYDPKIKAMSGTARSSDLEATLLEMDKEKAKSVNKFNSKFLNYVDDSLVIISALGILPPGISGIDVKEVKKIVREKKARYEKSYNESNKQYLEAVAEKKKLRNYIDAYSDNIIKSLREGGCEIPDTFLNPTSSDFADFKGLSDERNPTINDIQWWRKFCELASNISLLPIPLFTARNDLYLDLGKYPKMDFKYPQGSIVFDDDFIPRFLFYPIGMVIPTPFSVDGLYRIPIPPRITPITVQKVESPLNAIRKELSGKLEALLGMEKIKKEMGKFYKDYNDIPAAPDALITYFMELTGLNTQFSPEALLKDFHEAKYEVIKTVNTAYGDLERKREEYKNQGRAKQEELVNEVRSKVMGFIKPIKTTKDKIDRKITDLRKELEKVNPEQYVNKYKSIFTTVESIAKMFDACTGADTSKSVKKANKTKDIDDVVQKMQEYRGEANNYNVYKKLGINQNKLAIPNFDATNYFNYGEDERLKADFVEEMKKRLKKVEEFILDVDIKVNRYIDDMIREAFIKTRIDPLAIAKGLKIPKAALDVLPYVNIDFPELIVVPCIVQAGIFPYPILIIVNLGNVPVGPVQERSMMMLTIDFKDPLKMVKKNPMSKMLDIGTLFESVLNATLGYGVDMLNGLDSSSVFLRGLNLCPSKNGLNFPDIQNKLWDETGISPAWKKLKKDLLNSNYVPNPKHVCALIKAKDKKEELKNVLGSMNLSPNVPPLISKLAETGAADYKSGKVIIDNTTSLFPLKNYLDFQSIFQLDAEAQKQLNLEDMGISKKVMIDMFPQITQSLPFLIDDLPDWKRLNGKNIPFLLFLLQFSNTVRRGCKFPIPEVVPIPD